MFFSKIKDENLLKIADEEILKRSLSRPTGWNTFKAEVTDKNKNMFVINRSYWWGYTAKKNYIIGASYLIGEDENQLFAVRIPQTITKIKEALNFITPREAKIAQEKGKEVYRQGDIFIVEKQIKEDDMDELIGTRHEYRNHDNYWYRWIVHPQHKPIVLSKNKRYRAYRGTQVHGVSCD